MEEVQVDQLGAQCAGDWLQGNQLDLIIFTTGGERVHGLELYFVEN